MRAVENVIAGLICVKCGSGLNVKYIDRFIQEVKCEFCRQVYPVVEKIPIIINEKKSIFRFSDFTDRKNLFFDLSEKGRLISFFNRIIPSIGGNNLGKRNFEFIEQYLTKEKKRPRVLVIGGSIVGEGMSDFVNSQNIDIVESDVSFGPHTKIVFDGHSIPYENESFDCVIAQAVLEHVLDPIKCVKEMHRVLKSDGMVYAETPFMQQVHGGPYDFTRFSKSGHRRLFRYFYELKSGITAGSGTAMGWSYQYFLISLLGYGRALTLFAKVIARFTGFWFKYLDYLTKRNPLDKDAASGFFFIGLKSLEPINDLEIIKYYTKTQLSEKT
jgi:SAM-dependent methyltransferase